MLAWGREGEQGENTFVTIIEEVYGDRSMENDEYNNGTETVENACETLWDCQDAEEVHDRLKQIRLKIPKSPPDKYDPSEAFLAVQGASLRFLPDLRESEGLTQNTKMSPLDPSANIADQRMNALNWAITEESLFVAADLACLCVGPAWRSQIFRRQQALSLKGSGDDDHSLTSTQSTWATPSEGLQVGNVRSFSPATTTVNSSPLDESFELGDSTSYPQIPEVLPAAMLRFAASALNFFPDLSQVAIKSPRERAFWDLKRKNIAAGQRKLVIGLCCEPHPRPNSTLHDRRVDKSSHLISDTIRWTIPGANELVGNMLLFWLRFAYPLDRLPRQHVPKTATGETAVIQVEKFHIDWWYSLGVTRAAADLASTGWRPLPKTDVGPKIVRYLLEIAQSGISLLDPNATLAGLTPIVEVKAKEELLAALSSAAESISALASLGSRGLIPHESQRLTTRTVCRLHVVSGLMKASVLGLSPVGADQNIHNTSLPLHPEHETVLSQVESCLADTADLLWVLLGTKSSSTNAINALLENVDAANPSSDNCALFYTPDWDTRKKLVCMEAGTALRMTFAALWERHPGGFSTSHLRVYMGRGLDTIRSLGASVHSKAREIIAAEDGSTKTLACDLLSLALDTVVALGHFVDRQLTGDWDLTSSVEWERFLQALQEVYLPWNEYSTITSSSPCAPGLQSIIERAHIERQSLVIRMGAFLDRCYRIEGSPFHSIVTYESQRILYLFILRKVAPYVEPMDSTLLGLATFRSWVKFAFFPFRCSGWAEACNEILAEAFSVDGNNRYDHSSRVRAEALRLLTSDSEKPRSPQSDRVPYMSMFSRSRDVGDIHQKILPRLVPMLQSILSDAGVDHAVESAAAETAGSQTHSLRAANNCVLESYAVKLTGRLIRDPSIDQKYRDLLVSLLRKTALDPKWPISTSEENSFHFRLEKNIQLSAVFELGICLSIPFGTFPMLHQMTPQIIQALHEIIFQYTCFEDLSAAELNGYILLIAVALIPLCRLRLCADSKTLALLPSMRLATFVPRFLRQMLTMTGRETDRALFAPLIEVTNECCEDELLAKPNLSSKKTKMSLKPLMSAMILALVASGKHQGKVEHEMLILLESISDLCFHTLASFILSGFPLHTHVMFEDFVCFVKAGREIRHGEVSDERVCAFVVLLESVFARLCGSIGSVEQNLSVHNTTVMGTAVSLFRQLLSASESTESADLIRHSRAFLVILPSVLRSKSLDLNGEKVGEATLVRSIKRLSIELGKNRSVETTERAALDIQVLSSLMSIQHEILGDVGHEVSQSTLVGALKVCKQIISSVSVTVTKHSLYMAIRCLIMILGRFHTEKVENSFLNIDISENKRGQPGMPDESLGMINEFMGELQTEFINHYRFYSDPSDSQIEPDYHEELALEVERIEKFEVEKDKLCNVPLKASWLFGKSFLLTCRVGSSTSRYRGWVEIVIRSSTFRRRIMVRLLSSFSVRDPDFPSMLWSDEMEPPLVEENLPPAPFDHGIESILANYNNLVGRFDSLIPQANQDGPESPFIPSPANRTNNQASAAFIDEASMQYGLAMERATAINTSNQNSMTQDTELEARSTMLQSEKSIEKWVKNVLEDRHNQNDVLTALSKLQIPLSDVAAAEDQTIPKENDVAPASPIRRLQGGAKLDRAVAMLDRIIPMNTHKIALLYAGPKRISSNEPDLESTLLNTLYGSPKYHDFTKGLGELVPTKQLRYFSAGLDVTKYEADGRYARVWVGGGGLSLPAAKSVVVFHAVHLMPQVLNNRKRHVGNDNILIVFVDKDSPLADDISISDNELKESAVSGHFGFLTIYILPLCGSNLARVSVCLKDDLSDELKRELMVFVGDDIVAMEAAPTFVRSLAIRADLACRSVLHSLPPPCNSYERYQMLRDMERHVVK